MTCAVLYSRLHQACWTTTQPRSSFPSFSAARNNSSLLKETMVAWHCSCWHPRYVSRVTGPSFSFLLNSESLVLCGFYPGDLRDLPTTQQPARRTEFTFNPSSYWLWKRNQNKYSIYPSVPVCAKTSEYEHYHIYVNKFCKDTCPKNRLIRPWEGDFILTSTVAAVFDESDRHQPPNQNHSGVDCSFMIRGLWYQAAGTNETPVPTLMNTAKVRTWAVLAMERFWLFSCTVQNVVRRN